MGDRTRGGGRLRLRALLVLSFSLTVTGLASCGDEPRDTGPEPTTTTNPVPQEVRARALAERLAAHGGAGLFDRRFAAAVGGGRAVVFVGIEDDVAVAYFCDPARGDALMEGSADYGQIQLIDRTGISLSGAVVADRLTATLDRAPSGNGEIDFGKPASAGTARISRSGNSADGSKGWLVRLSDHEWRCDGRGAADGVRPDDPASTTTSR